MSLFANLNKRKVCVNPFGRAKCSSNRRQVTEAMVRKIDTLTTDDFICDTCRNQLRTYESKCVGRSAQEPQNVLEPENPTADVETGNDDETFSVHQNDQQFFSKDVAIGSLNKFLSEVDISPVKKERLNQKKYCNTKVTSIVNVLTSTIFEKYQQCEKSSEDDMLEQLKQKLTQSSDRNEKVKLLTLLPRSWSVAKISHEFPEVTKYMIQQAKALFDVNGILTAPDKKKGKALNPETKALARTFYLNDEVSRLMPGKKDFVSIKEKGVRRHEQKRLVLCNLRELYSLFASKHPNNPIGFSTFAELRPDNCILAGASGTHTVCVCSIHQNPILMLDAVKRSLSAETEFKFDYKSILKMMNCEEPNPKCYFGECTECPGAECLRRILTKIFDDDGLETVQFKQWVSTDRATLETLVKTTDQFIDSLLEKLFLLSKHSFIAKQQSEYLDSLKKDLPIGHVIVLGDFAENMSFVVQDEVQGFHWNNDQATIHPMVFYYKNADGVLECGNFVPISECLDHDTTLVHVFLGRFNKFLKTRMNPTKIIYFTDGCAAQYKNRNNFYNMTLHEHDFGVPAEWHFYATSHGKSACDGLGGTIKRLVTKASLQRPLNDQILTPLQMFDWANENILGMNFEFVTNDDYKAIEPEMDNRYLKTVVLSGTRSYHCFVPVSEGILKTKIYSLAEEYWFKRVVKLKSQLETSTELMSIKKMT